MAADENGGAGAGEGAGNEGGATGGNADSGTGANGGAGTAGEKGTSGAEGGANKGAGASGDGKDSKGSRSEGGKAGDGKAGAAKDGDQKAGGSDASGKGTQKGAPADVELKLPDGVVADPGMLAGLKDLVKAGDLSGEAAQKAVDLYTKAYQSEQTKAADAFTTQQKEWVDAIQADKELGGNPQKLLATRASVDKAMQRFATDEFRGWLNKTGMTNNPELVRVFNRIGQAMKEDSIGGSTAKPDGNGAPKSESEKAAARYETMK